MSGFLVTLQDSWLFQKSYIITGLSAVYIITGLSAVYIITGLSAVYIITGLSAILFHVLFHVFFMPMIMFSFMIMLYTLFIVNRRNIFVIFHNKCNIYFIFTSSNKNFKITIFLISVC